METLTLYRQKVLGHTASRLLPAIAGNHSDDELIEIYRRFIKLEDFRIRTIHRSGANGVTVGRCRTALLDTFLQVVFEKALDDGGHKLDKLGVTLVATGGYGRGILNLKSDIDVLFLLPDSVRDIPPATREFIVKIQTMLWTCGFDLGSAVRTVKDCILKANGDNEIKTSLIESRLVLGDEVLHRNLPARFRKSCIDGKEKEYLAARESDLRNRHRKYAGTPFVQQPHVKNGCGGLRDYQNLIWMGFVKCGTKDVAGLLDHGYLTERAYGEIEKAYEFLHRVRNELHLLQNRRSDTLTLRLQGEIATNFGYPQKTILRRIETFMREYYIHSRNMLNVSSEVMDRFHLDQKDADASAGLIHFLARRKNRIAIQRFDGFVVKNNRLFPAHEDIFASDPGRLMRLFSHAQLRNIRLSPGLFRLVTLNFHLINKQFRYSSANRDVFESILSRKGQVGRALRQMHRTGFLSRYLPEFGALSCLVQHEFFHQFTADEHTLTVIDKADELLESKDPGLAFFKDLFLELDDPSIFYLAIILHDTGRAANVRTHADASALLAARVARRFVITGERLRLLIFLVDHHLTLYFTATKRPLDDPDVIAEFARTVRNKRYLDALFLFTYVDSKGTSSEGWNSWKETAMRQLYLATLSYWDRRKSPQASGDDLRPEVAALLPPTYGAEIAEHFAHMPANYFTLRNPATIAAHIRRFRAFFVRLHRSGNDAHVPETLWVQHPSQGCSEFIVTSWDRPLLIARIAGALASHGVNILSADIYQRAKESLVLDIFRVCTKDFTPVNSERTRRLVGNLIAEAFSVPDFDFSDLIAQAAKALLPIGATTQDDSGISLPRRAFINQKASRKYTVIDIQAIDRIGLLHEIFAVVGRLGLSTSHARITTEKGAALDTLYIQHKDRNEVGRKVTDPSILSALQAQLDKIVLVNS